MCNLEMLMNTAFERIRDSSQKTGNYTFTANTITTRPLYIHYALKKKAHMDVLSILFTTSEWFLRLDIEWTETDEHELYTVKINGMKADSLSYRNIWAVNSRVNCKEVENSMLWWLTQTNFPSHDGKNEDEEDEWI